MKLKSILASTLCLGMMTLVGCSTEKAKDAYPVMTNQPTLPKDSYAIVDFAPGDNSLTEESKTKIKNVLDKAENEGKDVDNIKVLSWSDTDTNGGAVPTEFDRSIASERSDAIEEYIKEDLKTEANFKNYNMAESKDMKRVVENQNWKRQPFSKAESRTLPPQKTDDLMDLKKNTTSKALVVVDSE
jgi:hypothetical protein